jgi:tubulin delta
LLRHQLEKIDYFGGFQVLQSLAGGTGSGLGAHLVQRLREDYSKSNLLCTAVWPYQHGEVVLQNYNVLLTLSRLASDSSGLITLFNDEVLQTCRELLKNPRPSYSVMNRVIAQQMASIFFPVANTEKPKVGLWSQDFSSQM